MAVRLHARAELEVLTGLALLIACGGPAQSSVPSASPPLRQTQIAMSGALTGSYTVVDEPGITSCGTGLPGEHNSISYVLNGHVEGAGRDVGVSLQFAIHRYVKPGTFSIGTYPSGSSGSPAVASVVREITPKNIVSWISGSGTLLVDPGAQSGTLNVRLNSPAGLGELTVFGTWVCAKR